MVTTCVRSMGGMLAMALGLALVTGCSGSGAKSGGGATIAPPRPLSPAGRWPVQGSKVASSTRKFSVLPPGSKDRRAR